MRTAWKERLEEILRLVSCAQDWESQGDEVAAESAWAEAAAIAIVFPKEGSRD